jgi:preprotein translocase subunit YajC
MLDSMLLLAQTPPPGGGQSPMFFPVMMMIVMVAFIWMNARSQKKRDQERKSMLDTLKKGDRILFSGGILGTVEATRDKTMAVRLCEGVKIEIARSAVNTVLAKDEDIDKAGTPGT